MSRWRTPLLFLLPMATSGCWKWFFCRSQVSAEKGPGQKHSNCKDQRLTQKCPHRPASVLGGVTEVVIGLVGSTQGQRENLACLLYLNWNSNDPAVSHQLDTDLVAHDQRIVQGATNGHVVVIGHHCKKQALYVSKYKDKTHLCCTSKQRNMSFLSPKVCEHSRKSGRHITDFQEGKITEEKVHGSLESLLCSVLVMRIMTPFPIRVIT